MDPDAKRQHVFFGEFMTIKEKDDHERHEKWMERIRSGFFGFTKANKPADYRPRGNDSWKALALGTSYDLQVHRYTQEFLNARNALMEAWNTAFRSKNIAGKTTSIP
uniref:Uncharacterized protein n=1 Tax=Candidatus Kentrum sp. FW TaxID=2126338 RepID=A0A450TNE0_9GAMM|nr:MAG: hypothetical protein BECKFW1821C_GA0114237_101838 [Candidatus Kentron sp. FW]